MTSIRILQLGGYYKKSTCTITILLLTEQQALSTKFFCISPKLFKMNNYFSGFKCDSGSTIIQFLLVTKGHHLIFLTFSLLKLKKKKKKRFLINQMSNDSSILTKQICKYFYYRKASEDTLPS